jgi:hypothetical protein
VPRGYTAHVSFDNPIPFRDPTTKRTHLMPVRRRSAIRRTAGAEIHLRSRCCSCRAKYMRGIAPAALPTAGWFDELSAQKRAQKDGLHHSGYGIQDRVVGGLSRRQLRPATTARCYGIRAGRIS